MDDLDIYWADISAVFGLNKMFGPPLQPGKEISNNVDEKTVKFLQSDVEMAEFVEDFVMDAYNIMLREEIVPTFWEHFIPKQESVKAGFDQFCTAIGRLYADVKLLSPHLEELSRLRDLCNTHRTIFGQRTLVGLFCCSLKGTMHSQLPQDWEELVRQFYTQAFSVFYKSEDPNTSQDPEDSGDWSGDLTCGGCGYQTEACVCHTISMAFQLTIARMGELGLVERLADQVVVEIVQDKITSHVQETCKGSFDCSYLASLEEWLDMVVLAWLKEAQMTGINRKKLLEHLYNTYTKARIEQLFNIIIEFPDSQPALEDLRDCLVHTDLRSHLTSSLKQVLDAKLLHPGVNTADILTAYIAAIRALRVLDGSGVVLELVCQDVRRYLKTREDTVRCIVQSLIDDSATELTEELQKTEGLHLDHSFHAPDDWECLEDWENWQPDPVDAPSKHRGRRSADIISMLVNIYGSKELFVNEYRSLLSNRLLAHCSYDTDKEIRHLELLKLRFGEVPLHQCEVMLKDIGDSKRMNSLLHTVDGGCPELQTQAFPVNSLILSAQFWPQFKAENLELPHEVTEALDVYTKAFQTLKGNRTLVWKPHLGFANIDLEIGDKKLNLTVSPIHAAIIYKFQEAAEWTGQQLATSLKVPLSTLRRKITFWQSQGLLVENTTDTFTLVEEGEMKRGAGFSDVSGVTHSLEEDQEDSITASSADQREEELGMFWSYILGMLTNLESLPLERIYQMLRIFAMQGPSAVECDMQELRAFLDTKVRQHKLSFSGGHYRLPK